MPAMDRYLRPVVSCSQPSWLAMDQLAEFIAEIEAMRGDAVLGERLAEAKLGELAYCRRLQVDANPQRGWGANCLINANRYSSLMQAERKAQPADATACNDDLQIAHLAATRGSLMLRKVSNSTLRNSPSPFSTLRM